MLYDEYLSENIIIYLEVVMCILYSTLFLDLVKKSTKNI